MKELKSFRKNQPILFHLIVIITLPIGLWLFILVNYDYD